VEVLTRAERRLDETLVEAKAAEQIAEGRKPKETSWPNYCSGGQCAAKPPSTTSA
jgi:hypothetical protein